MSHSDGFSRIALRLKFLDAFTGSSILPTAYGLPAKFISGLLWANGVSMQTICKCCGHMASVAPIVQVVYRLWFRVSGKNDCRILCDRRMMV